MQHIETQQNTDPEEGNTKPLRARKWCITLNNWSVSEYEHIKHTFLEKGFDYIIGKEVGESKTPHLQIYIESKNATTFKSIKNICNRFHIEKARGTRSQNVAYCSKDNDFITNIKIAMKAKVRDPMDGKEMRPFQQNIMTIINGDIDDRKIYWFYDEEGNTGKTTLAKHICLKYPNKTLFLGGKGSDIKYGVKCFIDNEENDLQIVIFHFTRSVENFISYEALESIKDGIFYNTKYESGMVLFNPPHIICLANFTPNEDKLSADRWVIEEINHNE